MLDHLVLLLTQLRILENDFPVLFGHHVQMWLLVSSERGVGHSRLLALGVLHGDVLQLVRDLRAGSRMKDYRLLSFKKCLVWRS